MSTHPIQKSIGRSPTVLPRELGLDVATRSQRLHSLDDIEVLDGDLGVLGEVVVLLGDEDSLTEEGLSSIIIDQPNCNPSKLCKLSSESAPGLFEIIEIAKVKSCIFQCRLIVGHIRCLSAWGSLRFFGWADSSATSSLHSDLDLFPIPRGSPYGRPWG